MNCLLAENAKLKETNARLWAENCALKLNHPSLGSSAVSTPQARPPALQTSGTVVLTSTVRAATTASAASTPQQTIAGGGTLSQPLTGPVTAPLTQPRTIVLPPSQQVLTGQILPSGQIVATQPQPTAAAPQAHAAAVAAHHQ